MLEGCAWAFGMIKTLISVTRYTGDIADLEEVWLLVQGETPNRKCNLYVGSLVQSPGHSEFGMLKAVVFILKCQRCLPQLDEHLLGYRSYPSSRGASTSSSLPHWDRSQASCAARRGIATFLNRTQEEVVAVAVPVQVVSCGGAGTMMMMMIFFFQRRKEILVLRDDDDDDDDYDDDDARYFVVLLLGHIAGCQDYVFVLFFYSTPPQC